MGADDGAENDGFVAGSDADGLAVVGAPTVILVMITGTTAELLGGPEFGIAAIASTTSIPAVTRPKTE